MGRPRLNHSLPKYASSYKDVRGKTRVRLRKKGLKQRNVSAKPGTAEFTEEYYGWLNGKYNVAPIFSPRTFDHLIETFYQSSHWTNLEESTKKVHRGQIEGFRRKYGANQVTTMKAHHVYNLLQKMKETPSAANNLRKRLKALFNFAIIKGWRTDNPVDPVRGLKTKKGGFQTWQEEDVATFEKAHPIGTKARLAFDLALYTAQRRGDLATLGPDATRDGSIQLRQQKTDKPLVIPIHVRLAESIAAAYDGHGSFIKSNTGSNYTAESFGNWFADQCRAANIRPGLSLHGLRKAAVRRMAECGLTNAQIKSITGHEGDAEVALYAREANQIKIAAQSMEILNLANFADKDCLTNSERHDNA